MKMVLLTILEARRVLEDLEMMDERYEEDLTRAIEIMEESLHYTVEVDIGKDNTVPSKGHQDTQVVQLCTSDKERGESSLVSALGVEECAARFSKDD